MQGLIIGIVGTVSGAGLGVSLSRVLDHFQLIRMPADVYQVSYLPFTVRSARPPAGRGRWPC